MKINLMTLGLYPRLCPAGSSDFYINAGSGAFIHVVEKECKGKT